MRLISDYTVNTKVPKNLPCRINEIRLANKDTCGLFAGCFLLFTLPKAGEGN